jgi:hypothetical protein
LFVNGINHDRKYDIIFYHRKKNPDGSLGVRSQPYILPLCGKAGTTGDLGCGAKPGDSRIGYRHKQTYNNNYKSLTGECLIANETYTCDPTCSGYNGPKGCESTSEVVQSVKAHKNWGLTQAIDLSWSAPPSKSPITSYTITATPGGKTKTVVADSSKQVPTSTTFTGLSNGTSYTFTVTATTAAGTSSPSSPSNAAIPSEGIIVPTGVQGAPGAPDFRVMQAVEPPGAVIFNWDNPQAGIKIDLNDNGHSK